MNPVSAVRSTDAALRTLVSELLEAAPEHLGSGDPLHRRYWERALLDPASDILRRPGKEVRRRALECAWVLAGGTPGAYPDQLPLVVELLHVGSLVIDDIEDDSPMRRGEPALHRRFGVPVALNTGNWLYFMPLALLSRMGLTDALTLALYTDISDTVVLCHQGQALDLATNVSTVRQSEMLQLVSSTTRFKTGALMRLAMLLGARTAGATGERLTALARFGAELGVGLQMLDDWSGIHVESRLHKGIEDLRHGRPTWPWAWLAETSDEVTYAGFVHDASLVSIDWEAQRLIARMRERLQPSVPALIHARLQSALDELEDALGQQEAMGELRRQVTELETAYG